MYKFTRSSYFWNYSSELGTLVNQNSHAAPIRSPVRGRMGFSKSLAGKRYLLPPPPTPLLPPFCSRPTFRAARMRKPLSLGPNFVRIAHIVRERLLRRLDLNTYLETGTQASGSFWIPADCMMALKGSLRIRGNIRNGRLRVSTSERARLTTTLILNFFFSALLFARYILFSSSESETSSSDKYSFTVYQPNSLFSANLMAFMRLDTIPVPSSKAAFTLSYVLSFKALVAASNLSSTSSSWSSCC